MGPLHLWDPLDRFYLLDRWVRWAPFDLWDRLDRLLQCILYLSPNHLFP